MHLRIVIILLSVTFLIPTGARAEWAGGTTGFETYTFEREIRLAPGEFYAVTYDDERKEFVGTEPDRDYGCLPDSAFKHILRAPMWLREKFADRLVDLHYDDIDVGEDAVPAFYDVNGDGLRDLIVDNADGELRCFAAPYFKEDNEIFKAGDYSDVLGDEFITHLNATKNTFNPVYGKDFSIMGAADGTINATNEGGVDHQLVENLNRIKVEGNSHPVFEDVTGDGLPDLLIGSSDGTISVYKNYGTKDEWWFVSYNPETDRKFEDDVGYLSSPCILDVNGDNIEDIVTGAKHANAPRIYYGPDYTETDSFNYNSLSKPAFDGAFVPALGDFNGDGICDHAIGFHDGAIHVFITDGDGVAHKSEEYSRGLRVPGFAAPCVGDFNNDDIYDLVVGAGDGNLYFFKGTGKGFEMVEDAFEGVDAGEYPYPAGYDFNNDGSLDLVVGNRAGGIKVFLAPDWDEVEGGLGLVDMGDYASPAFGDLTGDGIPELLIGSLDGTFRYFEGHGSKWAEKYSWQFHPTYGIKKIEDFFTRTHPEAGLLRGAIDDESLNNFLDVLDNCGDEYIDEVAFAMANTQTEILRVMSRLGNADLVFENAHAIYDFASKVKYASIKEKDDYTTIEYISEDGSLKEMPRDIYYWWVVHPVVEYEIPARVDASYWRHDAEYYGVTGEEWTRKEITAENYEHTPDAYFWRTFLPVDRRYGKNLLDVVEPAENIKEAAYLIADWITFSGSKPGRWNEYGKASNDLQPLVIYEKNYGSCGEQAMIGVAFSRAALIPNAPVGCHGEDHAWNEWWMDGKWYKWDVGNAITEMGHPWYEGRGHTGTPRLTITRRRGDGVDENSTTRPVNPPGSNFIPGNAPGYSEVGKVHIRVVDEIGEPIEGAFLIVRSKWNNYYRTSIWDHTDPDGYCYFELGDPVTGSCVVDVITPLGVTGTEYFVVRENEEFEYTYTLPGRFNGRKMNVARGTTERGREDIRISVSVIEEEQRPANYSGARSNRSRNGGLREKTGFYGTRWFSEPNMKHYGVYSAKLSAEQYGEFLNTDELPGAAWTKDDLYWEAFSPGAGDVFLFYNANRYTHVRFKATLAPTLSMEKPVIKLAPPPTGATTGEKIMFEGTASDNLHVAAVKVSFNGGIDFTDITDTYDRATGEFAYTWDTGAGGPKPAGDYQIVFRVEDDAGSFSQTTPLDFMLNGARHFTDQVIYQDNPDTPLPTSSWMLGPFTVDENERFIGIDAFSAELEFDMDLFLFYDKNGNRKLDGMNEQIASSTSPTAIETILRNDPKPGVYWVFCQGWQVKERTDIELWEGIRDLPPGQLLSLPAVDVRKKTAYALLDVSLSFSCYPVFIVDIKPVKKIMVNDPVVTGAFLDGFSVDMDSLKVTFAGNDISDRVLIDGDTFTVSMDGIPLVIGEEYEMNIQAETVNGLADSLTLMLTAAEPQMVKVKHTIDENIDFLTVEVVLIDESVGLGMVRAKIDELPWVTLDVGESPGSAKCDISLIGIPDGEHNLIVEYLIVDGESVTEELSFKLDRKAKQKTLIKMLPGDGAKVFDHQSPLVSYFSLEIKDDVSDVTVLLDGEDISDLATIYSDGIIYLPTDLYSKGEHVFEVIVTLTDGRVIEGRSEFTVLSMDEVEEEEKK